jgi:isopenicillin N synthase-like dioxygenase
LVARELGEACKRFGFFYLKGHGIGTERLTKAHQLAKSFFLERGEEEKFNLFGIKDGRARGYQKLGQNVTKYKRDWHEALDYYAEPGLLPKHASPLQTHLFGEDNVWPLEMKQFYADYIKEMLGLGRSVMRAMALSLNLPEEYFEPFTEKSFWVIRVIGYPPLLQVHDGDGMLNQDETMGALQVLSQGEWINADPMPGALVVNIGDMIEYWTNGLYKSTL